MKSFIYIALLVIAAPLSFGQTKNVEATSATPSELEIIELEHERLKAFARDDKATFSQLVTDDLTMTHSSGEVANKREVMAVMRPSTPERPLPALSTEDINVRVYGDAAVMTGRLVETARDGRRVFVYRFTNTYIKQNGQWRMSAGQLTTLSRERAAIKSDPKSYGAFVGQYRNPTGRILNVVREGDKLLVEVGGQKEELFPAAEDQFFIKAADVLLVFVKDERGRVIRLINRRPNGDVIQEVKIN